MKQIIRRDIEKAETIDNRLDKTRKSVEEVAVLSATFRLSKQRIKEISDLTNKRVYNESVWNGDAERQWKHEERIRNE